LSAFDDRCFGCLSAACFSCFSFGLLSALDFFDFEAALDFSLLAARLTPRLFFSGLLALAGSRDLNSNPLADAFDDLSFLQTRMILAYSSQHSQRAAHLGMVQIAVETQFPREGHSLI
jgi:hypothetical protein